MWYDIYCQHRVSIIRRLLPGIILLYAAIGLFFVCLHSSLINTSWENDLKTCDQQAACMRSRGWHGNGPEWEKLK